MYLKEMPESLNKVMANVWYFDIIMIFRLVAY